MGTHSDMSVPCVLQQSRGLDSPAQSFGTSQHRSLQRGQQRWPFRQPGEAPSPPDFLPHRGPGELPWGRTGKIVPSPLELQTSCLGSLPPHLPHRRLLRNSRQEMHCFQCGRHRGACTLHALSPSWAGASALALDLGPIETLQV